MTTQCLPDQAVFQKAQLQPQQQVLHQQAMPLTGVQQESLNDKTVLMMSSSAAARVATSW